MILYAEVLGKFIKKPKRATKDAPFAFRITKA
jgi:hypothetical protein